ncbi:MULTISPECIES: pyridoxamine 5'-phosphate oxidase family protein [Pontibacillus]|uniref:Pyridoxamine 5'-phosphate oxidase family protein n=1 Tax=Pontibacillus chungwhensis TaxID=265426 RepID=A0ABY8V1Z2_9BACI|nr:MULTISPECIES: pyridoxamine 5'-phosphate oxidase family protein [Pontibacillus]MCD5322376.1 pyridoxamine 5'-phosphate oxidase family protein [Pontibacillus sp. HN14]WIF99663.1 pyridoxamine 5'-phosphate oxidase family protein [Pontibacillus chungwhensis]
MNDQQAKDKILEVLDHHKIGTLATVQQNKPHSRYMTFHNEELHLYTATDKDTHKAEEIENNPYVHILLGYDGDGFKDPYIEVEGKAVINDSKELKEKLWNDYMKHWFKGPEDPDYIVLDIQPTQIRLMNVEGEDPKTIQL